jgi:hypothetical protein
MPKSRAENFSGRKVEQEREGHHRHLLNHVNEVFWQYLVPFGGGL